MGALLAVTPAVAAANTPSAAASVAAILASGPTSGPMVDLLVGARPGRMSAMNTLSSSFGSHERGAIADLGVTRVQVPASSVAALTKSLLADPSIGFVEPDARVGTSLTPNDPYSSYSFEWGLQLIGAQSAWDISTGANGPIIAVIDTGVDASHPDLGGRVLPGIDLVNGDNNANDDNGHGTHVAGIIAASGNNGIGGAGVCWGCQILPVKVLDASGSGWYSTVAAGITWAADHGASVINMSLGGSSQSDTLAAAVAYAQSKGIVVVAAAGNSGANTPFYPAAINGVLAVAASDTNTNLYSFSNYGPSWVSVAAPGCSTSTWNDGNYQVLCGTSMASPFVAGSIGLLLAADPGASPIQAENALLGTAGPELRDSTTDGFIHTDLALTGLLAGYYVPAPVPVPTPGPTDSPSPSATPSPTDSPSPSPTDSPSPSATPAPTDSPSPSLSPSPSAAPAPTDSPRPSTTPTPSATPAPTPTPVPSASSTPPPPPSPTPSASPTPTSTPTPSASPTPTPTPTPNPPAYVTQAISFKALPATLVIKTKTTAVATVSLSNPTRARVTISIWNGRTLVWRRTTRSATISWQIKLSGRTYSIRVTKTGSRYWRGRLSVHHR